MIPNDNTAEVAELVADQSSINLLDCVPLHGWRGSPAHRFIQLSVCQHCSGADSTATTHSELVSENHGSFDFWPKRTLLKISLLLSSLYLPSLLERTPLMFFSLNIVNLKNYYNVLNFKTQGNVWVHEGANDSILQNMCTLQHML